MVTNNSSDYSPTQYAVQTGGALGTLNSLSVGATNSILQGSTGAQPSFTTTPQLTGLGIGAASTGSGLTFDGVNTLEKYVLSGLTPGVAFGGGTTSITYSVQTGSALQIGNCVFIAIFITLTSKGSSTGTMTFTGLPITSATSDVILLCDAANITFTGNYLAAYIPSGGTVGNIQQVTSAMAVANLTDTNFANNSSFQISGFYYV